jgi:hypothetical protein
VQVRADGCALHGELVRIAGDGEHTLRLAAASACTVEVVDAAGRPVRGAIVRVIPQPAPAWLASRIPSGSSLEHWDVLPAFVGCTDRAGLVALQGCAAGEIVLACSHPGFGDANQRLRLPQPRARVQLPACGAIDGQLFDQGDPATAAKWRIVARRVDDSTLPASARSALPDVEGRFVLGGLTPGEYELTAEPSLIGVRSLGALLEHVRKADYTWGIVSGASLRVTVRAGETSHRTGHRRRGGQRSGDDRRAAGGGVRAGLGLDRRSRRRCRCRWPLHRAQSRARKHAVGAPRPAYRRDLVARSDHSRARRGARVRRASADR